MCPSQTDPHVEKVTPQSNSSYPEEVFSISNVNRCGYNNYSNYLERTPIKRDEQLI